jgi:hypothetical protein
MKSLSLVYNGGTHFENLTTSIKLSGDIQQSTRKLDVEFKNTVDGYHKLFSVQLGRPIHLIYDGVELFQGFITDLSMTDKGNQTITACDLGFYLTNNTTSKKYTKIKASDIVKKLCDEFNIPKGTIVDTGYYIPKMIKRSSNIWDIMVTAITMTKKETKRQYWLHISGGKLHLTKRSEEISKVYVEEKENLFTATYTQSIAELKNKVVLISGDIDKGKLKTTIEKDSDSISKYGLLQHEESVDEKMSAAKRTSRAKELLKDLSKLKQEAQISCEGIPDMISGRSLYVKEAMTGLVGGYYIQSDSHTFANGTHKMDLTIKKTDDLPKLDYTE